MRFRWDRIWGQAKRARSRQLFKYGAGAVGAGTRCPVIGATGAGDGFRRTACRTDTTAAGVLMGGGEVLTMAVGVFTRGGGAARMRAEIMMVVDWQSLLNGSKPSATAAEPATYSSD